ncbi:MAG: Gmad2 immunoglobulin-like domain-containing protein [Pyrinomonadaceae bacterium]
MIEIQQPKPFDLVGNPILIGGIGSGFEATLQYNISEGHDERSGFFMVGGGTGEHDQFQISVDVSDAAFQLDRLFVFVYDEAGPDPTPADGIVVPVIYGPRIVPGYYGYRIHTVLAGQTLSAIANTHYGDPARYLDIVRANPMSISDPNLIFPGQQLKIPMGS